MEFGRWDKRPQILYISWCCVGNDVMRRGGVGHSNLRLESIVARGFKDGKLCSSIWPSDHVCAHIRIFRAHSKTSMRESLFANGILFHYTIELRRLRANI